MRTLLKLATFSLLAAAVPVHAAVTPPCLSAGEFTALANYALPSVINGTTQRCAATLPAGAYLRSSGPQLAQRYAARKPAAWPGAKQAFLKLSNGTNADANELIRSLPDQNLQQMFDTLIQGMVSQQIKPDRCGTIDRLVSLLAPLPPENTAELIALAVGLGAKSGRAQLGAISICPA